MLNRDAARSAASVVRFEHVSFRYERDVPVLEDFSFDLTEGRRTAIVGSSGCGKSTLLRLVTGRLLPTWGRIILDLDDGDARSGAYGLIGQSDGLLPWRTVEENILAASRVSPQPSRAELQLQLKQLGLSASTLTAYPNKLSVGMRKRVEILRALANPARLLLADEPFAALDLHSAEHADSLIHTTLDSWGAALMMVTHDLQKAVSRSDDVLVFPKASTGEVLSVVNPANGLPSDHPIAMSFRLELAQLIGAL